jgi:hypothetical protein
VVLAFNTISNFAVRSVRAASIPQYKIIPTPGRDIPVAQYEDVMNKMAREGWQFDNWVYRGSGQTPDLLFRKQ